MAMANGVCKERISYLWLDIYGTTNSKHNTSKQHKENKQHYRPWAVFFINKTNKQINKN